jgi:hypothetical protein
LTETWSDSDLAPEMIGPADALFGDANGAPSTTPTAIAASASVAAQAFQLFRIKNPPLVTLG